MTDQDLTQTILTCKEKTNSLIIMTPSEEYLKRLSEIDHLANDPFLWTNPQKAGALMKERQKLNEIVSRVQYFKEQTNFYLSCLNDMPGEIKELADTIKILAQEINDFEFKQLFSDPIDDTAAILSINSGAGGLEAANWVSMLLRMYCKFADQQGFKIEILDEKRSEEHSSICLDSVSIRIEGKCAYGFFKGETGVHRLIRNSPFSSQDARHTSFAAVSTFADIEDEIDIEILEKDLEITAQRSGGSGGQAVNKVSSACRIKHLPTGINILVRTERDFHQNKRTALKMLKAKLYDLELKKKQAEENKQLDAQSDVAFGHQCRSYVESPQSRVVDHRTDYENRDFQKVLDGDIYNFVQAYLHLRK